MNIAKLTSIFSLAILLSNSTIAGDVWPEAAKMFSGKKPSTAGCFDFSKPVRIKQPKGNYYRRTPKNKQDPGPACAPELSKRIEKFQEEYSEIKKEVKEKISEVRKAAMDKSITDAVDYNAASNALGFDINLCLDRFLYNHVDGSKAEAKKKLIELEKNISTAEDEYDKKSIAKSGVNSFLMTKKSLSLKEKDRVNTILMQTGDVWDILKSQNLKIKKGNMLLDPYLKSQYIQERINILKRSVASNSEDSIFEYKGKQGYRTSERDSRINFLIKTDEQKLRMIISKSSSLCQDLYLKNSPSVMAIDSKLKSKGKLISELRHAKKQLCDVGGEINKCPTYKEEFLEAVRNGDSNDVLQDKFENMLTLVNSLNFMEGDFNYNDTVTVFNYDEYKSKIKKGTIDVNERRVDILKTKYKKSSKAYENYLKNVEAAKLKNNTQGFKPVNAACGGCSVLKQSFREAEKANDYARINSLYELDQSIGCNVIKAKSCSTAVNSALRKNSFNTLENKTIGFDGVFEKLQSNPKLYQDKVQSLMSEVFKVIDSETSKPCAKCNEVEDRLQDISDIDEGKFSLKEGADKAYFNSLKNIALELNCLEPDDFKPEEENSCNDYSNYFKGLSLYYGSLNELTVVQTVEKDQKLVKLYEYQDKNNENCCDEIINYKKEMNGIQYIKKDDIQTQLAEAMQCLRCEPKEKPDDEAKVKIAKGEETSCDWFKNKIAGKSKDSTIEDLLLPVHTSEGEGLRNYTIDEFINYEVYTCSDGPAKSHIRIPNAWETKTFAPNGKYGSVFDYKLKCFVDPETKESVILTCCTDATANTPLYKELHSHVKNSPIGSQDFVKDLNFDTDTVDDLNKELADGKANTFCNHVYAGYKDTKGNAENESMNICYDHNDNVVYKVDSYNKTNWGTSSFGTDATTVQPE